MRKTSPVLFLQNTPRTCKGSNSHSLNRWKCSLVSMIYSDCDKDRGTNAEPDPWVYQSSPAGRLYCIFEMDSQYVRPYSVDKEERLKIHPIITRTLYGTPYIQNTDRLWRCAIMTRANGLKDDVGPFLQKQGTCCNAGRDTIARDTAKFFQIGLGLPSNRRKVNLVHPYSVPSLASYFYLYSYLFFFRRTIICPA